MRPICKETSGFSVSMITDYKRNRLECRNENTASTSRCLRRKFWLNRANCLYEQEIRAFFLVCESNAPSVIRATVYGLSDPVLM